MNYRSFLEEFGNLANAPNGVNQIRRLVYHLAFTGALVEPSMESSASLVDELSAMQHPDGGKRRDSTAKVTPFHPIPRHWTWVNIGLIGHDWGQMKPSEDFTYIDVSAIDNMRGVIGEGATTTSASGAPSRARKIVRKGTVIYSTVRPYLLNIAVVDRDFDPQPIASTAFAIVHPFRGVEAKFVYYFLRSPAFVAYVESVQSGIAYPAISDKKFFAASFPLPPTEEQKRIVTKVDELMALCDKLEAQQQERKEFLPALSRACKISISDSPTHASLKRLFDDVGRVIATDLRELVLTLAIQGCLSKPSTGAKAKVNKHISPPFPIPIDWEWRLLESVVSIKHGHAFKSDYFTDQPQKYILTTPGNFFESGGFRDRGHKTKYYTGPVPEEFVLEAGDLIIPMTEQAAGLLGSPAFVPDDGKTYLHNQRLGKITPKSETVTRNYLACFFNSSFFRARVGGTASGMKVRHTSPKKILQIPIPVPPQAEQQRIVDKVEELTRLVDRLAAQQRESEELAEDFAKFTVA
jgi:type I restriction enzyme S subunit